jgi:peptidoglycan/xylan/chitin deacetylase (PgdA/CDA1 family)
VRAEDGGSVLIITYHAVESGSPPLCIDPVLFREHLDALDQVGAATLTVGEVAQALRGGRLPERGVAITFDDGLTSVAAQAAPLLAEHSRRATIFAVAGTLGQLSDWPSQPLRAAHRRLLDPAGLRELADAGIEIGAHGVQHAPLVRAPERLARAEVLGAKQQLEALLERPVTSFAYPYGGRPSGAARRLVEHTYEVACSTATAHVTATADRFFLPRVDAHYLRDPDLLAQAVGGGLGFYLGIRRAAARARRVFVKDYRQAA